MNLKWKAKRDGAAVHHRAVIGEIRLCVTNWPGSYTIEWSVTYGSNNHWFGSEDRRCATMASIKEKAVEKALWIHGLIDDHATSPKVGVK